LVEVGPADLLREEVTQARDGFQHLITEGGASSAWFLADERRGLEQRLLDTAGRVGNKHLQRAVIEVSDVWKQAFGAAPGPRGMRVYGLDDGPSRVYAEEDAELAQRSAVVAQHASNGLSAAEAALKILNMLETRAVR
jgi:hypothetical protein